MTPARPRIGITTYGASEQGDVYLPAEYAQSVRRAGGIPLLITPGETRLRELLEFLDGLILAGGGDIDPEHYGGTSHATVYSTDAERDRMELQLARLALECGLPTLAICRGLQVVNVALGGTLHVHLPDRFGERVLHRAPPREPVPHALALDPTSRLAEILQATSLTAMSWHHQAADRVPADFRVVARAPDGVVEAIESPAHPRLLAVQWHPELTAADDPIQQRLFAELLRLIADA